MRMKLKILIWVPTILLLCPLSTQAKENIGLSEKEKKIILKEEWGKASFNSDRSVDQGANFLPEHYDGDKTKSLWPESAEGEGLQQRDESNIEQVVSSVNLDKNFLRTPNSTEVQPTPEYILSLPEEFHRRMTVLGKSTSLEVLLNSVAKRTGFNISYDHTVNVSNIMPLLNFKDTEVWEILEHVLFNLNYSFEIRNRNLIILSQQTYIFNLNIPETISKFTNLMSNESFMQSSGNNNSTGGNSGQTSGQASGQAVKVGSQMISQIETTVDFWGKLRSSMDNLVSDKGSYDLNSTLGKITVTDTPNNIRRINAFIKNVKKDAYRRVMIEARIFKTELTKENRSGVDLNLLVRNLKGIGALTNLSVASNFATQNFTSGSYATFTFTQNNINDSIIQVLSETGDTTLISEPRIVVLNGHHDRFNSGDSEAFAEQTSTSISQVSTEQTISVSQAPSIISVGATPLIVENDRVIVNYGISLSDVKQIRDIATNVQGPDTSNDNLHTTVLLKNGETTLIGGVISNNKIKKYSKIPLLGDIPGLKKIFSFTREYRKRTELIVFITAYILD